MQSDGASAALAEAVIDQGAQSICCIVARVMLVRQFVQVRPLIHPCRRWHFNISRGNPAFRLEFGIHATLQVKLLVHVIIRASIPL
eukprot:2055783-Alexandrium_andersonii.AAC.1